MPEKNFPTYRFTGESSVSSFLSASVIFRNCYSARSSSSRSLSLISFSSSFSLPSVWRFREHLSRALPTEKIFYLLRSIPSEQLKVYFAESMPDMLQIIIKWLQVSVSECDDEPLRLIYV